MQGPSPSRNQKMVLQPETEQFLRGVSLNDSQVQTDIKPSQNPFTPLTGVKKQSPPKHVAARKQPARDAQPHRLSVHSGSIPKMMKFGKESLLGATQSPTPGKELSQTTVSAEKPTQFKAMAAQKVLVRRAGQQPSP